MNRFEKGFWIVCISIFNLSHEVMAMGAKPNPDPNAPPPPAWVNFMPIIVMVAIFYFLLIRPQSRQKKDRQSMVNALKNGDKVITQGGFYATVVNASPNSDVLVVKLNEETKVTIQKSAVVEIVKEQEAKNGVVVS